MHWLLHLVTHKAHLLQLPLITGLKIEVLEIKPRNDPTGHIVLQYNLPLIELMIITNNRKRIAKIKEPATKAE